MFSYRLIASPAMQKRPCSVSAMTECDPGVCPGEGTTRRPGSELDLPVDRLDVRLEVGRHAPAALRREERATEEAARRDRIAQLGLLDDDPGIGEQVAVAGVVPVQVGQDDELDVLGIDAGRAERVRRLLVGTALQVLADELLRTSTRRDARVHDDRRRSLQHPHDARDRDGRAGALGVGEHRLVQHARAGIEREDRPLRRGGRQLVHGDTIGDAALAEGPRDECSVEGRAGWSARSMASSIPW